MNQHHQRYKTLCYSLLLLSIFSQPGFANETTTKSSYIMRVSADFLRSQINKTIKFDDSQSFQKSGLNGTVQVNSEANLNIATIQNNNQATFKLYLDLKSHSNVYGKGWVSAKSYSVLQGNGTTQVTANKDFTITPDGGVRSRPISMLPFTSIGISVSTTNRAILFPRLRASIVSNYIASKSPKTFSDTLNEKHEDLVRDVADHKLLAAMSHINNLYLKSFYSPFFQDSTNIGQMSYATTPTDFFAQIYHSDQQRVLPLAIRQNMFSGDFSSTAHANLFEKMATKNFAGKILSEDQVEDFLPFFNNRTGTAANLQTNKTLLLDFSDTHPLKVNIHQQTLILNFRLNAIIQNGVKTNPGWLTVAYAITPDPSGIKFNRTLLQFSEPGLRDEAFQRLNLLFPSEWIDSAMLSSIANHRIDTELKIKSLVADDDWLSTSWELAQRAPETRPALVRQTKDRFVMAAIGDSMSVGFNSGRPFSNWNLSWSTGRSSIVRSHLDRLRQRFQTPIRYYSAATTGARAVQAPKQAETVAQLRPDYVTFLIGTNDVCDWDQTSLNQGAAHKYGANINTAIETLVTANRNVKITLVPIPQVNKLRELFDQKSFCQDLIQKSCPASSRPAELKQYIAQANSHLRAVAARYPQNTKYISGVENALLEKKHVSPMDCFHPSTEGQKFIADYTWSHGWY